MTFTITVKFFTGQSHTFEMVESYTTVKEFKLIVCAGFGGNIIPSKQRLIVKGKQLEDHRTLDSYELEAPILIYLTLRLAGGCDWIPDISTTFPHPQHLRNVCVDGKHWWDIPAPKPVIAHRHNWYPEPELIHGNPAPYELYCALIENIRDTPMSLEEVAHQLLTEYGYVKQANGYRLPENHPYLLQLQKEKEVAEIVKVWSIPKQVRCMAFTKTDNLNNLDENQVTVVKVDLGLL